jgi:hypothetical protein
VRKIVPKPEVLILRPLQATRHEGEGGDIAVDETRLWVMMRAASMWRLELGPAKAGANAQSSPRPS